MFSIPKMTFLILTIKEKSYLNFLFSDWSTQEEDITIIWDIWDLWMGLFMDGPRCNPFLVGAEEMLRIIHIC